MTSKTPKLHWASLTASEKASLHWKMLEGHGYSGDSIIYGGAFPCKHLSQFALHHSRREPYRQLSVGPRQFSMVLPSLTAPAGLAARGEEHLLYQEYRELFLRTLSRCLYKRHLELTLRRPSVLTTTGAPTSSIAPSL